MVELKKEAVKDVTSLTKATPVALAKTKEVLNQAVADLLMMLRLLLLLFSILPCFYLIHYFL